MITDRFTKKIIGMVPTSIQVEEEDLLLGSDKSTHKFKSESQYIK